MNKTQHTATASNRPDEKRRREPVPDESRFMALSEFFRVFGDVTRIKILFQLSHTELCVHEIASLLAMSQSAISHQLRVLKQSRLVKYRRDGRSILYSLDDDHVKQIIGQGFDHIKEGR